jgi:hypothetical protein
VKFLAYLTRRKTFWGYVVTWGSIGAVVGSVVTWPLIAGPIVVVVVLLALVMASRKGS